MEQKKKIALIFGLGHSGSTMLAAKLASEGGCISLGEVEAALGLKAGIKTARDPDRSCTCGVRVADCPVWGSYLDKEVSKNGDFKERYISLIHGPYFRESDWIVDSSKSVVTLNELCQLSKLGKIELRVIYLVKDVRAWVASMLKSESYIFPPFTHIKIAIQWYRANRRMQKMLNEMAVKSAQVSYESFCSDPQGLTEQILNFLSINPNKTEYPNVHMTYGNAVRFNMRRLLTVTYDTRHLQQFWTGLVVYFIPGLYSFNQKTVYHNSLRSAANKNKDVG